MSGREDALARAVVAWVWVAPEHSFTPWDFHRDFDPWTGRQVAAELWRALVSGRHVRAGGDDPWSYLPVGPCPLTTRDERRTRAEDARHQA